MMHWKQFQGLLWHGSWTDLATAYNATKWHAGYDKHVALRQISLGAALRFYQCRGRRIAQPEHEQQASGLTVYQQKAKVAWHSQSKKRPDHIPAKIGTDQAVQCGAMLAKQMSVIVLEGEEPQHCIFDFNLQGFVQSEGQPLRNSNLNAIPRSQAELAEVGHVYPA